MFTSRTLPELCADPNQGAASLQIVVVIFQVPFMSQLRPKLESPIMRFAEPGVGGLLVAWAIEMKPFRESVGYLTHGSRRQTKKRKEEAQKEISLTRHSKSSSHRIRVMTVPIALTPLLTAQSP
jgi:hypothetical protein